MTDPAQKDLDDLLSQIAQQAPPVPSDLMARVLIDADQLQPQMTVRKSRGMWANVLDIIGGWPAFSGIAMAGMAGLWIGVAPPTGLDTIASDLLGETQTVDLFGADVLSTFIDELDG